jgi:hypothetical protein
MRVFDFLYNNAEIFLILSRLKGNLTKNVNSSLNLMKIQISKYIFEISSRIQFHEKRSIWQPSWPMWIDGRTSDGQK